MFTLLISEQEEVVNAFSAIFAPAETFAILSTMSEVEPFLWSLQGRELDGLLVFLECESDLEAIVTCRRLCHTCHFDAVSIVALITEPDVRQAVFDAGADDYLLQPILAAEVQAKVTSHTNVSLQGLNVLLKTIHRMNTGSSPHRMNQAIRALAEMLDASSAYMTTFNLPQKGHQLIGSYNLPVDPKGAETSFWRELSACAEVLQQTNSILPQIICRSDLAQNDSSGIDTTGYFLSLPLHVAGRRIGILNFTYHQPPQISPFERRNLALLGQNIGILLEMFQLQEEAQTEAIQGAFMVLFARILNEYLDLYAVLNLTLEVMVPLLNASYAAVWLVSTDQQWLELASSLDDHISPMQSSRRAKGAGLLGWILSQERPVSIDTPTSHPRFDPQIDRCREEICQILGIPLRHREEVIGVLVLYNEGFSDLTDHDKVLLEGVVALTASAVVNTRVIQHLRHQAKQQQTLYEMSQQIATGLDLETTLNRAIYWLSHLADAEIGLLWLADETSKLLSHNEAQWRLMAAFGLDYLDSSIDREPVFAPKQSLLGNIGHQSIPVLSNEPFEDFQISPWLLQLLRTNPHNLILVPMVYQGKNIGVISLFNKRAGSFIEADLTLLCTATEMVAIAIDNAQMHTQTISLMEEREKLQQQIFRTEQLTTIGRLTASLCHEINNPMQAIQGALALALEEIHEPQEIEMYLNLCRKESKRVVALVDRMRQIYRPQTELPKQLNLNALVQEATSFAQKELRRQKVTLAVDLAPNLPPVTAIANQLHLVLLSMILNMGDTVASGGVLRIYSLATSQGILIDLLTERADSNTVDWQPFSQTEILAKKTEVNFGLSMSYDIMTAHGGTIYLSQQNRQISYRIQFPLMTQDTLPVLAKNL